MSEIRPQHFPPGTLLGKHYVVEGLVRLSEGRMFYLVNDDRPDQPTRRCWHCGFEGSPRTAKVCHTCGSPLVSQRFLVSSRWYSEGFRAYDQFAALRLDHPGLAAPLDVLRTEDQLLSVVPYRGEGLMLDEASPLANQRVLHLGQRLLGVIAYLGRMGVRVGPVQRANLLVSPNGAVRLFDLDILEVSTEALPPSVQADTLREFAVMLRSYCHVHSVAVAEFLDLVASGDFPTSREFGRAIEARFDTWSAMVFPASLGAMSDVGLTRQLNEDNWAWCSLGGQTDLYVVADGMGGHDCGEIASALAVSTLCGVARTRAAEIAARGDAKTERMEAFEVALDEAFQSANQEIHAEGSRRGKVIGTTMVALVVHDGRQAYIANVGDSRAYLFRDGTLHQVTVDHSFVQKLVERGRLSPEDARNHPRSNILLRTVGTEREVEIDLFRVELESGDRLMLCSDGLWGEVEDADIAAILTTYTDPRVAARELIRASHQGGGKDNCTVVVVVIK
jgi:serine/threonine protein phosphatase PrpC